ncbi:hypothetical protein CO2235_U540006 [Cupriavidus oxalaticus]|uniref:Uncharacterized protein n=1 Tax=Cupriavidus oxalaticus TaxID=96344 RepID=A0A375FL04_9BURK|nr:hypothetical protein CO2235_U540006 [Cupriavidus oxalaticus]
MTAAAVGHSLVVMAGPAARAKVKRGAQRHPETLAL